MAVDAEVFPVGAVRGIIVVVIVFMMDSQELPVFVVELFAALGTYETVNLQRAFPVVAGGSDVLPHFFHNLFNGFALAFCLRPSRFIPTPVCHGFNRSPFQVSDIPSKSNVSCGSSP